MNIPTRNSLRRGESLAVSVIGGRLTRRTGSTLTEVLMSLMIMGIGVVSLATLFPISALRTLEATHMTNSVIGRYNAEALLDAMPELVFDPDGLPATRHTGQNYLVDPLGVLDLQQQLTLAVNDPLLTQFEYSRPATVTWPDPRFRTRYLGDTDIVANRSLFPDIDVARQLATLSDTLSEHGEGFATAYTLNSVTFPVEVKLNALADSVAAAQSVGSSDSGWQLTIFDQSGDFSEVRPVLVPLPTGANPAGQTVSFAEALPAGLTPGLIRIETVDQFYSFLYSVRNRGQSANVDVVVFFKRDFNELSQQVYVGDLRRFTLGADGQPGVTGVDDNGNDSSGAGDEDVGEIGYPNSDDARNSQVVIDWDIGLYTPPAGWPAGDPFPPAPPLRKGGYLYDPLNGLWYRIRSVDAVTPARDTAALVTLEDHIRRENTEDLNNSGGIDLSGEDRDNDNAVDRGGVIIPKGVLAVFPLETKSP